MPAPPPPTLGPKIPSWIAGFLARRPSTFTSIEERMRLAVDLSRRNIEERTGGPFGAAVFGAGGDLVSVGVNLVVGSRMSIWHAEMVALAWAQAALRTHDLSSAGRFELVSSCDPCAMCLGAVPWSGIQSLVCGAGDADARSIGFDEGEKPTNWIRGLESRGVRVRTGVLAQEAQAVLLDYVRGGGILY